MDSESDNDGRARHSNVKRLVKTFTDDTKSDNVLSEQEDDASDKDNDESHIKKMKIGLDDDELNYNLDDQEDYASAQENNDDSEDQTNENSDGNDEEPEREIAPMKGEVEQVENYDDEDAEDMTFRQSFTTLRRSKTRRRQAYNTKPEDMTNEIKSDNSIENNEDSLQKLKAKRQQSNLDDTESSDDDSDEHDNELDIKEDEENHILDDEENVYLHSDEVTEDDDEQHINLDSSLDVDDSMLLKASKSNTHTDDIDVDDETSDNEEDIPIEDTCDDIKSILNLRFESADKDAPSDEGVPRTISEIREDDKTTNNNSLTRFFKVNMHQFNENKEQDNHQEQDDVSENNDKDSKMAQEHEQFIEDNFYSFIFKDPMEDLKALTGRIVKDATVFQAPTNRVPPDTPPPEPESDKYYEDENEIPEPPPEPAATEKEEPEEPHKQLEAQNLEPKEEEEDVRSESEEEMPIPEEASQEKESILRINTNALGKASQTYELERFEKNALIVFNQEKIPGYERRKGTIKDANDLASTFEKFGFEISSHIDQTKDEIFRKLEEFAATDFSDYGCVAVAVMTHGSGGYLRAKDRQYHETHIINYFKSHSNPTLVTKPKIIIIQACRGKKITPAVLVKQSMSPLGKIARDHDEHEPYTLPTESDILVLHSTYAGNPSHRDETYGTWFIQTLCKKIDDLAHEFDLESIFTEVQREVAIDKEHKEWNIDTKKDEIGKQMPVKMSTLIRKLFLSYKDFARHNPEMQSQIHHDMMVKAAIKRDSNFSGISSSDNFTPCACFLDKFLYLTDCMRYFVEDYPEDEVAKAFLETAESFGDGAEFNKPKEKFSRAIINHLKVNAEKCEYYKYLNL